MNPFDNALRYDTAKSDPKSALKSPIGESRLSEIHNAIKLLNYSVVRVRKMHFQFISYKLEGEKHLKF